MSRRQEDFWSDRTDHRGDLCNGGQEEPNETLSDGKRISDRRGRDAALPTCVQRTRPKPIMVPYLRRRSKPTSIVSSRTTSVASVTMMFFLLLSGFSTTQTLSVGAHVACSCRQGVGRQAPKTLDDGGSAHLGDTYTQNTGP